MFSAYNVYQETENEIQKGGDWFQNPGYPFPKQLL